MKTITLFITTILFCAVADAQMNKKSLFAGEMSLWLNGNSFEEGSSTSVNEHSYMVFTLGPSYGGFISSNVALGGTIRLNLFGQKDTYTTSGGFDNIQKYNSALIDVGPFLRFYKFIGDKFSVVNSLQPSVQFGSGTESEEGTGATAEDIDHKLFSFTFGYNLSVSYLLKENLAVEFRIVNLAYTTASDKYSITDDEYTRKTYTLQANSVLNYPSIGIVLYFGNKK
jgi:hypothetical protein